MLSAGGSDLVTASNNLDSSIGTLSALNTTVKSSLVAAINDIDSIANANLNDSAEMKGLFATYTDSSQQIAFDSAGGQFRIFHSTITSYVFKSRTELKIMNAAGATLKTGYPSAPGIGTETDASFTYQQDQSFPYFPGAALFDTYGYVHYNSAGEIRTASDEADIYEDLISQCITDIKTGDEVGSYRVSTGAPTSGGAGTWDDKGTFYTDTTYSNGSTVYKLWLKRSLNSVPGSDIFPLGLDGSNLKERTIIESSDLVQRLLLDALTRRIFYGGATGDLNYTVATSSSGTNKGTFTDTRQTATTNTNQFSDPYYRTYSTPSGSSVTQTTYYFNLS